MDTSIPRHRLCNKINSGENLEESGAVGIVGMNHVGKNMPQCTQSSNQISARGLKRRARELVALLVAVWRRSVVGIPIVIQERELARGRGRLGCRSAEEAEAEAEGEGLTPKCRVGTEQSAGAGEGGRGNGRTEIKKERKKERGARRKERKKGNPGFLAMRRSWAEERQQRLKNKNLAEYY